MQAQLSAEDAARSLAALEDTDAVRVDSSEPSPRTPAGAARIDAQNSQASLSSGSLSPSPSASRASLAAGTGDDLVRRATAPQGNASDSSAPRPSPSSSALGRPALPDVMRRETTDVRAVGPRVRSGSRGSRHSMGVDTTDSYISESDDEPEDMTQ